MANTLKFGNGEWYGSEGNILAYNDENGNFKPLPFDFSRGSSATRVNQQGLIETVGANDARVDYKDNANGALLLEPQRTNSLLQSNQFDTTWTLSSSIDITSGHSGVGGSNNAWLLKRNSTGSRYVQQSLSLSSAQYSYSVYLKAESTNWAFFWSYDGSESVNAYIDLENGVVGNTAGSNLNNVSIESVGNGWYRVTLIYTQGTNLVRIYPAYSNGSVSIGTDNGIYIQHAQLEVGSYETSIINTQGAAQTRLADSCSNGGNEQVINSTEGVLYIETKALSNDLSEKRFGLSDGTSSNVVRVGYSNVSNRIIAVVYNGANQAILTYTSPDITQNSKIAVKYKANDFALWVDGVKRSTDASGSVFTANTLNSIGFNIGGGSHFYSETKEVRVYNTALSDQELAALTQV